MHDLDKERELLEGRASPPRGAVTRPRPRPHKGGLRSTAAKMSLPPCWQKATGAP